MSDQYILEGHKPVPAPSLREWGTWMNDGERRRVGWDVLGDVKVSTVFLGLDHSFGEGPPLLFETMIFGGKHDEYQERYSTWEQAEAGHAKALALVKSESPE